jgi:DNA-binding MarR family transcriptional regulator
MDLEKDMEMLEGATRLFFQTMKRPHTWSRVTEQTGIRLDRPSAIILQILATSPATLHVQDLADRLGIEAPSVTRKTQMLEQSGYLRRVPYIRDRRLIDLRITPRGRAAARKLWKTQRSIIAEAFQSWDAKERRQFVQMFERFSNDLLAVSPSSPNQPKRRISHV